MNVQKIPNDGKHLSQINRVVTFFNSILKKLAKHLHQGVYPNEQQKFKACTPPAWKPSVSAPENDSR